MRCACLLLAAALAGCATPPSSTPPAVASGPQAAAPLETILQKQIYQMTPVEAGRYVAWVHQSEPDLRKRIAAIGRKNIGQPYSLNLLGEFPYEVHDNLPMFSLDHSDCVVFAEHTYAMALSQSWEEFFWMLQRIRYRDGVIGVATRNHYTEMDWNVANRWLVTDISAELAGAAGPEYPMTVDRARFLKTRHHTERSLPVESSRQAYVGEGPGGGHRQPAAGRRFRERDLDPQRRVLGLARRPGGTGPGRRTPLPAFVRAAGARRELRVLHRAGSRARGTQPPGRQERPGAGRLQVPAPERQCRGAADGAAAAPRFRRLTPSLPPSFAGRSMRPAVFSIPLFFRTEINSDDFLCN
jgi:hypothetical protein